MVHAIDVTEPAERALTKESVHGGNYCFNEHLELIVGDFVLPCYPEDEA